jgi:hypothetical protein
MKDRLARIWPRVQDDAVAATVNLSTLGQLPRDRQKVSQERFIPGIALVQRGQMLSRHHQNVGRGLGMNVVEGNGRVVLENNTSGDFVTSDFAENAVIHGSSSSQTGAGTSLPRAADG